MRDYRSDFKNYCLTCKEYDIYSRGDSTHRGFRCKHHYRPMAFDESCSSYSFDAARGNSQIEDAVSFRVNKGYDPKPDSSYWYIVSTVSKIMNLEGKFPSSDNNEFMAAFADFRAHLMSCNYGLDFLASYDINGLRLASLLLDGYMSPDTKDATVQYIEVSIIPMLKDFAALISKGDHPGALHTFTALMNSVATRYNYTAVMPSIVDPNLIGSGKSRMLLESVE